MSFHSDVHNAPGDVAYRPSGTGMLIRAHCMGCGKSRAQAGGRGKPGPRWRCAVCVAEKAARLAVKGAGA